MGVGRYIVITVQVANLFFITGTTFYCLWVVHLLVITVICDFYGNIKLHTYTVNKFDLLNFYPDLLFFNGMELTYESGRPACLRTLF